MNNRHCILVACFLFSFQSRAQLGAGPWTGGGGVGGGAAFSGGEITQCLVVNDSTGADLEICEDAVTYDDAADQTLRLGNDGAGDFTLQIDGDVLFPNSGTIRPYKFTTPGSDVFWFQTSNASNTPSYRFISNQSGAPSRTLAIFATSWNDQFTPSQYIRTGYNFNTSTGTYTDGAFAATPSGIMNLGALNGGDVQVNDNLRTTTGIVTSTVAASGSAVAHTLDTTTDYGAGDTLLSVKDNGSDVVSVDHLGGITGGALTISGTAGASTITGNSVTINATSTINSAVINGGSASGAGRVSVLITGGVLSIADDRWLVYARTIDNNQVWGLTPAGRMELKKTFTSATRATCDAAAVGSQVMYDDGVDQISLCVCEQTGSGTFAWGAATSTGDCT